MCIYTYIYIYIYRFGVTLALFLHSAKGGAVETGCSDLHDMMILVYYIILPQSTAPPIHCTPLCRVSTFPFPAFRLAAFAKAAFRGFRCPLRGPR